MHYSAGDSNRKTPPRVEKDLNKIKLSKLRQKKQPEKQKKLLGKQSKKPRES